MATQALNVFRTFCIKSLVLAVKKVGNKRHYDAVCTSAYTHMLEAQKILTHVAEMTAAEID